MTHLCRVLNLSGQGAYELGAAGHNFHFHGNPSTSNSALLSSSRHKWHALEPLLTLHGFRAQCCCLSSANSALKAVTGRLLCCNGLYAESSSTCPFQGSNKEERGCQWTQMIELQGEGYNYSCTDIMRCSRQADVNSTCISMTIKLLGVHLIGLASGECWM